MTTAAERQAVERDGPNCRRCGIPLQDAMASKHHRILKGRGTPPREYDRVHAIVVMCGSGTTGCHGWAHHNRAEAREAGWILYSSEDPAGKPLITLELADGRRHMLMLLPDGGIVDDPLLDWDEVVDLQTFGQEIAAQRKAAIARREAGGCT